MTYKGRLQRLGNEAAWIIAGQVSVVIGSLGLVRVLSEVLTPPEYGQLALAMTVSAFGQTVIFGGFRSAITRYYSISEQSARLSSYIRVAEETVLRIAGFWTVILIVIALILFGTGFRDAGSLLLASIPYTVLLGIFSALTAFQNAARARRLVAVHQGIDAWLKVGFILFMENMWGADVYLVLTAYSVSCLLVCVLLIRRFCTERRTVLQGPSMEGTDIVRREMLGYATPIYIWGPFIWVQQTADRWSLGAFASTETVGLYALVLQLTYAPMRILIKTFFQFFAPIYFARLGVSLVSREAMAATKVLVYIGGIALAGTFAAFFIGLVLHDTLFKLLVARSYREASQYFPWMLLSAGLLATGQLASLRVLGERGTRLLLAPKLISATVGTALLVAGAHFYEIWGIIFAHFIFATLHLIWVVRNAVCLKI